jgi:hypothetical protein
MGIFSRRSTHKNLSDGHLTSNKPYKMVPQIPHVPLPKPPDPWQDPAGYLRSIHAVRERSTLVLEKAKRNQLRHFEVDMQKFADTASYVVSIIRVCIACH